MENYQAKGSQQMTSVNTSNKAEMMQSESLKPQSSQRDWKEELIRRANCSREVLAECSRKARLAGNKGYKAP
jgi:hypothetical protein